MKKNFSGGTSIFPTQTRPSVFPPIPPEDIIERQGEKFLWLRCFPIPEIDSNPGQLALPDGSGKKGYLVEHEKVRRLPEETVQIFNLDSSTIYPQYSPIAKIRKLYVFRDDIQGGNFDLNIKSFDDNSISIEPHPELKYWHKVQIDYDVKTFETIDKVISQEQDGKFIHLNILPEIIAKVHEVWKEIEPEKFKKISFSHDYIKIILSEVAESGRRYRVKYDKVSQVSLGYRTVNSKNEYLNNQKISIGVGDLEAIASAYLHFTKGDILISTNVLLPEKEIIRHQSNGVYFLKYLPVREIHSVFDSTHELDESEYSLQDMKYLKLSKRIEYPNSLTIVYSYNPAYRVISDVEASGLSNRLQPRKWILRQDNTNIVLG